MKKVHAVWLSVWQIIFDIGEPQGLKWDGKQHVIIFLDTNRVIQNIPVTSILRWTEIPDVTDDGQKQAGTEATQTPR